MRGKQYFDQVAKQWDEMRQGFFPDEVRDAAFLAADIQPGKIAADIGAGSGFITEGLLDKGLHVIVIDPSEAMLAVMKQKFSANDTIDYRVGESSALPIPDAAVDYVFANMVLHHIEAPFEGIQEMVRILKPTGKLIITDLDEHEFEFLRTEQQDHWLGFKREDIENWFSKSGLKYVKVDCVGEDCCAGSDCGCEHASISIFVASGEK